MKNLEEQTEFRNGTLLNTVNFHLGAIIHIGLRKNTFSHFDRIVENNIDYCLPFARAGIGLIYNTI